MSNYMLIKIIRDKETELKTKAKKITEQETRILELRTQNIAEDLSNEEYIKYLSSRCVLLTEGKDCAICKYAKKCGKEGKKNGSV